MSLIKDWEREWFNKLPPGEQARILMDRAHCQEEQEEPQLPLEAYLGRKTDDKKDKS